MQTASVNLSYPWVQRKDLSDRFLAWMGWVLLGYAVLGRGFAYLGVAPLYVGETTALFGLLALFASGSVYLLGRLPLIKVLVVFMVWGVVCTVPHLST
jgi:hypothetical protein